MLHSRDAGRVRQVTVRIRFVPNAPATVRQYLGRTLLLRQSRISSAGWAGPASTPCLARTAAMCSSRTLAQRASLATSASGGWNARQDNAFFSFFRAEGQSAKTGESLGRWGIGKQVFPTASRLHAMLGVTVRGDSPARALMGSAVVRSHSLGEQDYQPDGWFGWREHCDEPVSPVVDSQFIEAFTKVFGLERGTTPGLSIIVPSVDERVNVPDLRRGIVRSFFWPILLGELVVRLETVGESWRIDAETLATHRHSSQPWKLP